MGTCTKILGTISVEEFAEGSWISGKKGLYTGPGGPCMGPGVHVAKGPISGTISEEVFAAEPPTDRQKSLFTKSGGPCMGQGAHPGTPWF